MAVEIPDFDSIALRLVVQNKAKAQIAIVEQLRLVWNARGAVDIEAIEAKVLAVVGVGDYRPYLSEAIGEADR